MNRKYPLQALRHLALAFRARHGVGGLAWLGRSWRLTGGCFILRSAFGLNLFGFEAAVRTHPSFDQRLRTILKRVRQGIATHVAHRHSLALLFEVEIDAPVAPRDRTVAHITRNAHALVERAPLQR